MLESLPSRERELKRKSTLLRKIKERASLPSRERELKHVGNVLLCGTILSLPSRERELKP